VHLSSSGRSRRREHPTAPAAGERRGKEKDKDEAENRTENTHIASLADRHKSNLNRSTLARPVFGNDARSWTDWRYDG
jgi:hypothetical protein